MTALIDSQVQLDEADQLPAAVMLSPLAYAYMRVPCDIPDDKIRRMEYELRRHAVDLGFCFGTIFYEFNCGQFDAFDELMEELLRADAHHVIMPSYRHIARSMILQNSLLTRLEFDAQAEVHVLADTND